MKGMKVKPLKISDRQRGRIEKKGIGELHSAQQSWLSELRKTGHGGDWGSELYMNDGPIIYASAADTTKKVGMMEAMDLIVKGKPIFILPTNERVLLNPPDVEPITRSLDAVERFEMQNLMNELYPDMSKISLAKRIQERGPFRSAFETQSGKSTPHGTPVRVSQEVSRKMRSQILGIQPTKAEKLSARQSKQLRDRISERIYDKYQKYLEKEFPGTTREDLVKGAKAIGATETALLEEILSGSHQYIDGSERTKADFKRMLITYNQARKNNSGYLAKVLPRLKQAFGDIEVFEGFDEKFLNALSPTAETITEPSVIHLIYDIESDSFLDPGDLFDRFALRLLTGEPRPDAQFTASPAYVRDERKKSEIRFMATFNQNKLQAATSILQASRQAFASDRGILDVGFSAMIMKEGETYEKVVEKALDKANNDRKKGKAIKTVFDIRGDSVNKTGVMLELVKKRLAFPIGGVGELVKPKRSDYEGGLVSKLPFVGDSEEYKRDLAEYNRLKKLSKKQLTVSKFYLVPVFSAGFSKRPKGWDSRWVVPTFQILEEYADVLNSKGDKPSALELLYLIATRSKALYDYELSEAETMLLYTMLDPHDPNKTRRASVRRNPAPVNILPGANLKSEDLGDPFNDSRAKFVFDFLKKKFEEENERQQKLAAKQKLTAIKSAGKAPLNKSQDFWRKNQGKGLKLFESAKYNSGKSAFHDKDWMQQAIEKKGYIWDGKKYVEKTAADTIAEAEEQIEQIEEEIEDLEDAVESGNEEEIEDAEDELEEEIDNDEEEEEEEEDDFSELKAFTSRSTYEEMRRIFMEEANVGDADDNLQFWMERFGKDVESLEPEFIPMGTGYLETITNIYRSPQWMDEYDYENQDEMNAHVKEIMSATYAAMKNWKERQESEEDEEKSFEVRDEIPLDEARKKDETENLIEQLGKKMEDRDSDEGESVNRGEIDKDDIHPIRKQIEYEELMDDLVGEGNWNRNPKRAGLSMQPPSIVAADSKSDASQKQERLLRAGYDYTVMQKGKKFIVVNQKSKQFHKAQKEGYKPISIDSFMGEKALTMARKKAKKNPMTAECRKCGHRQTMKSLKDKCEKCGHDKFKTGVVSRRKASHSCAYRKTKRSKKCGGRVTLMKNGRIYKCKDCGAKYEMR